MSANSLAKNQSHLWLPSGYQASRSRYWLEHGLVMFRYRCSTRQGSPTVSDGRASSIPLPFETHTSLVLIKFWKSNVGLTVVYGQARQPASCFMLGKAVDLPIEELHLLRRHPVKKLPLGMFRSLCCSTVGQEYLHVLRLENGSVHNSQVTPCEGFGLVCAPKIGDTCSLMPYPVRTNFLTPTRVIRLRSMLPCSAGRRPVSFLGALRCRAVPLVEPTQSATKFIQIYCIGSRGAKYDSGVLSEGAMAFVNK